MHPLQTVRLLLSALALVGLSACNQLAQSAAEGENIPVVAPVKTEQINSVQQVSQQDKVVNLKGKVVKQVPLIEGIAYELQDSSGSIWVVTKDTRLKQGDEVVIRGKLRYQSIPGNGKDQGTVYIEQQEQLNRTPNV